MAARGVGAAYARRTREPEMTESEKENGAYDTIQNANYFRHLRHRISNRLEACDELILEASEAHISIEAQLLGAVRNAHFAFDDRTWNLKLETELSSALEGLRFAVSYPEARVVSDLKHCDDLISYAALAGNPLLCKDIEAVSLAHQARQERLWDSKIESAFYAALCRIAHGALPVRAATAGDEAVRGARRAIKIYSYFTIPLMLVVVALSCLLYVANQLSTEISSLVKDNDIAAMQLHNELESHFSSIKEAEQRGVQEIKAIESNESLVTKLLPGDDPAIAEAKTKSENELRTISNSQAALQIKERLQQFAINNRQLFNDVQRTSKIGAFLGFRLNNPYYDEIDCPQIGDDVNDSQNAQKANWICDKERTRSNLEIRVPILEADRVIGERDGQKNIALAPENDVDEGFQKIATYQDIRAMAMYGRDIILSVVGMVTGFVLPVLYAWLGACAAILRKINTECGSNLFHPETSKVANRSHITCAIIVGIAIGLMSDLIEGGKSFSPLALAFVAGYASNKFFYFVDRLVDTLFPTRSSNTQPNRDDRSMERSIPSATD
jgi:hypothetical protein